MRCAAPGDRSRGRLEQPQDGLADGRLAAAGFADQPERLALGDREAHAVDRVHFAPRAAEDAAAHGKCLGSAVTSSSAVRRPCPRRLRSCHRLRCIGCSLASIRSDSSRRPNDPAPFPRAAGIRSGNARSRSRSAARTRSRRSVRKATAPCRGFRPGALPRRAALEAPSFGMESSRPRVYGWRGRANRSATGASSTLRPAYITTTRCAISATTPRSCVIRMIAAPVSRA